MLLSSKDVVFLFLCCILKTCLSYDGDAGYKTLSRRKRYVSFPEGSSFSCAGCMTVGLIGQPAPTTAPGTFTFGLNWGIAYELPNTTETAQFYRKKHRKPLAQRRSRRELYERIELILDNMGYSGRQCILKTLCETTQRIVPHSQNMLEEIFRTLFTMPMAKVLKTEPLEHTIYDSAHRLGVLLESCDAYKCPLSLVDWAQGHYNAPAPTVDTATRPWALFSSNFGMTYRAIRNVTLSIEHVADGIERGEFRTMKFDNVRVEQWDADIDCVYQIFRLTIWSL